MSAGSGNNHTRFRVTHRLKLIPEYFEDVAYGVKRAEIRRNDRDFRVGDYLQLREWDESRGLGEEFTRRFIEARIDHIFDFGCKEGYVCLTVSIEYAGAMHYAEVVE